MPVGLDDDASLQERLDYYRIPVDAEEFLAIVDDAETVFDVQQATRAARHKVMPILSSIGRLEEFRAPYHEFVAERSNWTS